MLWWREDGQHFVRHSMLDLFRTAGNVLDISSAFFGFNAFETVNEVSKFWCYIHLVQNSCRVFTSISSFQKKSAQSKGATHPQLQRVSQMALSNLRCTGRQELCQSQNVLAPPNAMKLF